MFVKWLCLCGLSLKYLSQKKKNCPDNLNYYTTHDYINSCATLLVKIIEKYFQCRNSRSQMFFKVCVLQNFANFIAKHMC